MMQMYEPVTEGSYIKMIDMVSGRGKMEVNTLQRIFNCQETAKETLTSLRQRHYLSSVFIAY